MNLLFLGGQLLQFRNLLIQLRRAGARLIHLRIRPIGVLEIHHPIGVVGGNAAGEEIKIQVGDHLGEIRAGALRNLQIHPNILQHFLRRRRHALPLVIVAERHIAQREFLAILLPDAVATNRPAGVVKQLLGLILVVLHHRPEIILITFLVLEHHKRPGQILLITQPIKPDLR